MRSKTRRYRYRAPDKYLQYLYDYVLIPLEVYYQDKDARNLDNAVFWGKGGSFWLN